MNQPEQPGFNPGGIQDRYDNRDYQWSEIGFGSAPFDWNSGYDIEAFVGKLPVKDQNGSGSCGGQAWASYATALEAAHDDAVIERSAKFIYSQTYQQGGGSNGRDNATIYVKQGAAREAVLPSYDNGQPPSEAFMERSQDITAATRADATHDRSLSYAVVSNNIDTVAQAIRDNNGVVIGIDGENNGTWTSAYPHPPQNRQWGHWLYAGKAKLINGVKYIGVLNSWGTDVGESGWQWLAESYFTNKVGGFPSVWSVWTHVYNAQPTPIGFQHTFGTDLSLGMSGSEVVALQTALQLIGSFPSTVPCTGYFGNVTLQAVRQFQAKNWIAPVSGYVGPLTRAKLNSIYGSGTETQSTS